MGRRDLPSLVRDTLRSHRIFLTACAALLGTAALPGADSPPRARPEIRYEPIVIVSQWGPPTLRAELGRFRVPENRSSGSSRQIELAFVRLHALVGHPGPPIVWLSGGPGDSGTADLATPALELFLELRKLGDVILLDQRGTGSSVPRLDCSQVFQFPRDVAIERPRAVRAIETAARSCAEKWRAQGVDLSSYNTRESAEDVEDLRLALGSEKIRVLAGSYGTHLALAALRAHEESFDRVVLLGVVGPDHLRRSPANSEEQLSRIARLVAGDPGAGSADLLESIRRVRDRLAAHPATVAVETPGGDQHTIVVGSFDVEWYTRALLTSRTAIAHLPALFRAMENGDFSELARVADGWRSASAPAASIFTHRCASAASEARELRIARERPAATLGDATDFAEAGVCRSWGITPLPASFREPVRSSVPTLFVSGTLDGDAPESNAVEVMGGFPNGVHLRVEGAAHSLLGFDDAATRAAIVRFFGGRAPAARVALPALAFERLDPERAGPLVARAGPIPVPALFGSAYR